MSSLSRQLLSIAQSRGKDLPGRAHSLLQQSESKELELPVVLTMAQAGYRELRSTDEALFSPFADTLFGASWAGLERELKPREVGDEVDAQVSAFALAASPFLQLRATHACLEWLLRRFRVHVYNVDAMMEMALPHCDTAIFGRLLQILSIGANPTASSSNSANSSSTAPSMYSSQPGSQSVPLWHFLHPLAHSGAVLQRHVLSNQARKDTGVLEFLCAAAKKAASAAALGKCRPRTILTFFALVSAEVLTTSTTTVLLANSVEKIVGALVPAILLGLRDEVVRDHQISSFIIAAALLGRDGSAVSEACFSSIVTAACLHVDSKHPQHALSFLSAAFSGQALHHGYKPSFVAGQDPSSSFSSSSLSSSSSSSSYIERYTLTKKALLALLRSNDFTSRVTALTDTHDASVFLKCLLQSCVMCLSTPCTSEERSYILAGVSSLITSDASSALAPLIPQLTASILDRYEQIVKASSSPSSSSSSDITSSSSSLASILKLLGQIFDERVDDGIRIVQSTASMINVSLSVEWAAKVLSENSGLSYLPMTSSSSSSSSLVSLRLALFHSSASVRLSALQHVRSESAKIISAKLHKSSTSSTIENAVSADVTVAAESLSADPRWSVISQALTTGLADTDAAVVSLSLQIHADFIKSNLYCANTQGKLDDHVQSSTRSSMNAAEIVFDSLLRTSQRWCTRGFSFIEGGGGGEGQGSSRESDVVIIRNSLKVATESLLLASSVAALSGKAPGSDLSLSIIESYSLYLFSLLPIGIIDSNVISVATNFHSSFKSSANTSSASTQTISLPMTSGFSSTTAEAIHHIRGAALWVASTVTVSGGRPLHSMFANKVSIDGVVIGVGGGRGGTGKSPIQARKNSASSPSLSSPSWVTSASLTTSISDSPQAFDLISSLASQKEEKDDTSMNILSQRAKWHAIALIDAALSTSSSTSTASTSTASLTVDFKRLLIESSSIAIKTWSSVNAVIDTLASSLKSSDFSRYPEGLIVKSTCTKTLISQSTMSSSSSSSSSSPSQHTLKGANNDSAESIYSVSASFDNGARGEERTFSSTALSLSLAAHAGDQVAKSKLLNSLRIARARQEVCLDLLVRIVSVVADEASRAVVLNSSGKTSASVTDKDKSKKKKNSNDDDDDDNEKNDDDGDKQYDLLYLTALKTVGYSIAGALFETPSSAASWSSLSSILSGRVLVVLARSPLFSALGGEKDFIAQSRAGGGASANHLQQPQLNTTSAGTLLFNLLSILTSLVSSSSALLNHQTSSSSSSSLTSSTSNSISRLSVFGGTRALEIIRSLITSSLSSSSSSTSSSKGIDKESAELRSLLSCFRPVAFACLCVKDGEGNQHHRLVQEFKRQAALILKALPADTNKSANPDASSTMMITPSTTAFSFFGFSSSSSSSSLSKVILNSFDSASTLINNLTNDVTSLSVAILSDIEAIKGGRGEGDGGDRLILDNSTGPASPSIFAAFAVQCMQQFPLVALQLIHLTVKICKRNRMNREDDFESSSSSSSSSKSTPITRQPSRENHLKTVGNIALSILHTNAANNESVIDKSDVSLALSLAAVDLIAEVYVTEKSHRPADDNDEENEEDEENDDEDEDMEEEGSNNKEKKSDRVRLLDQSIAMSIVAEIVAILRSFSRSPPSPPHSSLSLASATPSSASAAAQHYRQQSILIKYVLSKLLTTTLWNHLIVTQPSHGSSSSSGGSTTSTAEKLGHELFDSLLSLVRRGRTMSSPPPPSSSSSSLSLSSSKPNSTMLTDGVQQQKHEFEYSTELSMAARTSASKLRPLSTKFLALSMKRNGITVSLLDATTTTSSSSSSTSSPLMAQSAVTLSSPMSSDFPSLSSRGVWSSEELALRKEAALTDIVTKIMNSSSSSVSGKSNIAGLSGVETLASRSSALNSCIHWLAKLSSWIEIAVPDDEIEDNYHHRLLLQQQQQQQHIPPSSSSSSSSSSNLVISDASSARTLHKSMFSSLEILIRLGETMMTKLRKKKSYNNTGRGGGANVFSTLRSRRRSSKGVINKKMMVDDDDDDDDEEDESEEISNIDEDDVIEESDLRGNIDFSLSLLLSKLRSLFQAIIASSLTDSKPLYTAHEADLLLKIVQSEASSTHTRSAALMLLSAVASVQPEGILRRLVWGLTSGLTSIGSGGSGYSSSSSSSATSSSSSMFSSSSSSSTRDDSKALSIMYKLIDSVVPPLCLHGPKHGVSHISVIRVITSMLPRISLHRQSPILVAFIKKLAESRTSFISNTTSIIEGDHASSSSSSTSNISARRLTRFTASTCGEFVAAAIALILSQLKKSASQHFFLFDVVAASASSSSATVSKTKKSGTDTNTIGGGGKRVQHIIDDSSDPLLSSIMKDATNSSSFMLLPSIEDAQDRSYSSSSSSSSTTPLQVNPQLFDLSAHLLSSFSGVVQMSAINEILRLALRKMTTAVEASSSSSSRHVSVSKTSTSTTSENSSSHSSSNQLVNELDIYVSDEDDFGGGSSSLLQSSGGGGGGGMSLFSTSDHKNDEDEDDYSDEDDETARKHKRLAFVLNAVSFAASVSQSQSFAEKFAEAFRIEKEREEGGGGEGKDEGEAEEEEDEEEENRKESQFTISSVNVTQLAMTILRCSEILSSSSSSSSSSTTSSSSTSPQTMTTTASVLLSSPSSRDQQRLNPLFTAISNAARVLLSSLVQLSSSSLIFNALNVSISSSSSALTTLTSKHSLLTPSSSSLSSSWEDRSLRQQAQALLLSRDVFISRLRQSLSLPHLKGKALKHAQSVVAADVNKGGEKCVQMLPILLTLCKQSLKSMSSANTSGGGGGGGPGRGTLIGKPISKKKQPSSSPLLVNATAATTSSSTLQYLSIPIFEMKSEIEEHALIGRLSLDVFTLITRLYGEHFPASFKERIPEMLIIAEGAASLILAQNSDDVSASSLDFLAKAITALATLSSSCSIAMLPFLPKTLSLALQAAETSPKNASSTLIQSQIDSFLVSIVSSIRTISVAMPTFLSSFLPRIFTLLMSRPSSSSSFSVSSDGARRGANIIESSSLHVVNHQHLSSIYYNLADYISVNSEGEPVLLTSSPYSAYLKGGSNKQQQREDSSSSSSIVASTCVFALETILDKVPTRNSFSNLISMLGSVITSANSSSDHSSPGLSPLSSPLVLLVRALTRVVCRMSRQDARENFHSVISFFLQAADNRWKGGSSSSSSSNNNNISSNTNTHILASSYVEVELSSLLACLSLKLSDKLLKTLLLRLISWAFEPVAEIVGSSGNSSILHSHTIVSSSSSSPPPSLSLLSSTTTSSFGFSSFASFSRRIIFFRTMDDMMSVAKEVFLPYAALCITEATRELSKSAAFAKSSLITSKSSGAVVGGGESLIQGGFGALALRHSKESSSSSSSLKKKDNTTSSSSKASDGSKKSKTMKSKKSSLGSLEKKKKKRRVRFGDEDEEEEEEEEEEESDEVEEEDEEEGMEEEESDNEQDEEKETRSSPMKANEDGGEEEEEEKMAEIEKKNSLPGDLNFTSLLSFLFKRRGLSEDILSSSSSSSSSILLSTGAARGGKNLSVSTYHAPPHYVTEDSSSSMRVIADDDQENDDNLSSSSSSSSSLTSSHSRYSSRIVIPSTAHALRCTVLSFLRRSLALDASLGGDASNSLCFMASGGRQRLDQVLSPIIALYTIPIAPIIDKTTERTSSTTMSSEGSSASKISNSSSSSKKRNREESTQPQVDHSLFSTSLLQFLGIPGGREGYDSFASTYLTPIISSLCMATKSNDSNWKPITQGLLMLTRDRLSHVRHASLSAVCEIFNRGGAEALVLLPETLPFLSELQSDTDSVVERICHELLHKLEVASGEDLSQYI